LELLVLRLIGTITGVIPRLAGGEVGARPRGCVVAEDAGPYVERRASVIEAAIAVQ